MRPIAEYSPMDRDAVASLDELGAMTNFWWRDAEPPLLTPLNALYHAVITMKNLPPDELARWRVLFNHYVFSDNGDPSCTGRRRRAGFSAGGRRSSSHGSKSC